MQIAGKQSCGNRNISGLAPATAQRFSASAHNAISPVDGVGRILHQEMGMSGNNFPTADRGNQHIDFPLIVSESLAWHSRVPATGSRLDPRNVPGKDVATGRVGDADATPHMY